MSALALFTGSANPRLAQAIARELPTPLGACRRQHFPDGELHLEIAESVRGRDVYLIQSTCAPVSDHLVELLLMADACRRAGADQMTAVMPYFGYARHDRRATGREPVAARLVADLIATSGLDRVVVVDLHTPAIEGFFSVPAEDVTAVPLLADAIRPVTDATVIVAPDLGASRLAEEYARLLNRPVATIHKIRTGPESVEVRQIVGDVRGKVPLIVDDMISTGHTLAAAVRALLAAGCVPDVTVVVSHGLFVGSIETVVRDLPIGRIVTTDSVPQRPDLPLPVQTVSLGRLLGHVVRRLHASESLADVVVHR